MYVENTRWFKLLVGGVALGTVWWLSSLVGVWPHGPQSVWSALFFFLCFVGAQHLYDTVLGIAAIAVWPSPGHSKRGH